MNEREKRFEWFMSVKLFTDIININNLKNYKKEIIKDELIKINIKILKNNIITRRKLEVLCYICKNFDNENMIRNNFKKYYEIKSKKEKLRLKYGDDYVKEYSKRQSKAVREIHKKNPRPTSFQLNFWINKGYSKEEAQIKLKDVKLKASKSRIGKKRLTHYNIKFWIDKGYSKEEAKYLKLKATTSFLNNVDNYILKYGTEIGIKKFKNRQEKRLKTMIKKFGISYMYNPNSTVSKESFKFFIPLYKKLRKKGINKNDIYWGINGSKEYCLNDIKNKVIYFYDFTIKSKKIIIEYNNEFWHPRNGINNWNGVIDYDKAILKDKIKKDFAIKNKFKYIIIWNNDNFNKKREEILNEIY